jgi:hypothetical protein
MDRGEVTGRLCTESYFGCNAAQLLSEKKNYIFFREQLINVFFQRATE